MTRKLLIPLWLCLGFSFLSKTLWAHEIDKIELIHDTYLYIQPQLATAMSPEIAYSLLQNNIIKNIALESDNDPEHVLYSSKLLAENPLSKVVNHLFYIVPNEREKLLPPTRVGTFSERIQDSTAGIILDELLVKNGASCSKNGSTEVAQTQPCESTISRTTARILDDFVQNTEGLKQVQKCYPNINVSFHPHNPKEFKDLLAKFGAVKKAQHNLIQQTQSETEKEQNLQEQLKCETERHDEVKIKKLNQRITQILKKIPSDFESIKSCYETLKKFHENLETLKGLDPAPFLHDLIQAVARADEFNYSKDLPFQMLMSRVLRQSKSYRQSLINVWRMTPSALNPKLIQKNALNEDLAAQFVTETKNNPSKELQKIREEANRIPGTPDQLSELLEVREQWYKKFAPDLFFQGIEKTEFSIAKNGPKVKSSDCCEATFFNFFTHFVPMKAVKIPAQEGTTQKKEFPQYDFSRLATRASEVFKKPVTINSDLQSLMQPNPTTQTWLDPKDSQIRKKIKEFTSDRAGLSYVQHKQDGHKKWYYDMDASVDNFLKLNESAFDFPDSQGMNRKERLDRLCKVFDCIATIEPPEEPPATQKWNKVKIHLQQAKSPSVRQLFGRLTLNIQERHCFPSVTPSEFEMNLTSQMRGTRDFHFFEKFLREPKNRSALSYLFSQSDQLTPKGRTQLIRFLKTLPVFKEALSHENFTNPESSLYEIGTFFIDSFSPLTWPPNKENPEALLRLLNDIRNFPETSEYLLPLVTSIELSQETSVLEFIHLIFDNKLESLYPKAIQQLYRLSGHYPFSYEVSAILKDLLPIQETSKPPSFQNKIDQKFRKDLKLIAKKVAAFKQTLDLSKDFKNKKQIPEINQWIEQSHKLFNQPI